MSPTRTEAVSGDLGLPRAMRRAVSVKTLAGFLDVEPRTIWRLVERGKIDAIRIGRRVRILPAAVRRYLDQAAYLDTSASAVAVFSEPPQEVAENHAATSGTGQGSGGR